jgi:hypothetical protein
MPSDRKERIARNEAAFRELNESLDTNVHRRRNEPGYAGFVCECGNDDCETTVRLALDDYAEIRADARLFFLVPGHEAPDTEDVVEQNDGYLVVRKHDDVAGIVGD